MAEAFVGTCGWAYGWNPDGLPWYARESGLNAVELNYSFYRFPTRERAEAWAREGSGLRWSIKVSRAVTHRRRMKGEALPLWERFREAVSPL
ncbi:MAG: DUF72 domain-containing protein, partial [Thermoproteota archaeon]